MVVNIKYFGLLNDNIPLSIELPEGANLKTFKDLLIEKVDNQTADILNRATFLVNKEKSANEVILKNNDLIMILTVLGGG